MKKVFFHYWVIVILSLLLVANIFAAKGPIKINYYLWDDPTYRDIVTAFNASQKEVVVNATYLPAADYETKILTILAGGADVDCYLQKRGVDMFPHFSNGYIEPLNKYIKKFKYDFKTIDDYESQITVDGKIIAIPFRGAGYYTYYNKKIFEKAGIPTPTEYVKKGEWTWDKFAEISRKLSTGDGKQYGAVMYTWPICNIMPAVQNQVNFITPQGKVDLNPQIISYGIKLRRDLERERAIIPLAELKATKTHYSKAFYDGNVGMVIMGEWFPGFMLSGKKDNLLKNFTWDDWACTRIPSNNAKYVTVGTSQFNHIYTRSKNKDAAFKFISWLAGPEGAKIVAKSGFLPPIINDEVKAELGKALPDADSLKYTVEKVPRYAQFFNKYGSKIEGALNLLIEKYLVSGMSEAEFITELEKQLQEIIRTTD